MSSTVAPSVANASSVNESASSTPSTPFGVQQTVLVILLSIVIVIVVVGNTLVIASVITTRRLRTVTNCFIMSLAVADWLVGIFVMPPAVAYLIMGAWELGWILCDIWVSLDILLCTASILSLCAISVDRYLAVTQPLSYSRNRRSKRLAFWMIMVVWVSSALITAPPMFGWYEPGRHNQKTCRYNKNTGYVIFSAMGSFFIPMVVMLYVYVRISCVIAQRHDQLSHIDTSYHQGKQNVLQAEESDVDRASSETEEGNHRCARYYRHLHACSHNLEILSNHRNSTAETPKKSSNSTRLLRPNMSFSYPNHEPLTPVKSSSSFFRSSLPPRTRPEPHIHLDASMLNYEPASRVSSFRRETKTAQTLSIVMGGFILCWLPFFIFYLLTPFIQQNNVNQLIMQCCTWLGWINSAINPFIYAFYSPDFRIAFWRLTVKHFKRGTYNREFVASQQKRAEAGNLMAK
ncbi:putative G-protein coupled receptor No18 isoform X2 [Rhynchophorus ferrugineus]|uniref:putative G-protein coupled receptor No18 isoform X2 n=1 Tax=Rhynchophorus ferrugineus TaxID=354439 RepID=UPI003FCCCA83